MTRKKSPNVYQRCPKMISLEKGKILTPFQKLSGQCGQINCCHRLWKVAQSAINRPIWSHWLGPSDWLTDVSKQEKVSKFIKVELASKLFNWQPPKDSFGRVQSTLIDFPLDLSITSDEVRQLATQIKRTWRKWPNMPGWINFRPAMSWFFAYLGSR